jgi:hypothetical protein
VGDPGQVGAMTKSPGAVAAAEPAKGDAQPRRRRRRRGSGGIHFVREGVYRVDIELNRDPVTGKRRRISRQIEGTYDDAEIALARLRVADHEGRLTARGTRARSVRAVLEAYIKDIEFERIEMAPKTLVTSRSAMNTMCRTQLPDGRIFGDIRLSQFNWQDVEELYRAMKGAGKGAAWIRRCATASGKKLDMGKSCLRFRSLEDLALDVVGDAIARTSVDELIGQHERAHP